MREIRIGSLKINGVGQSAVVAIGPSLTVGMTSTGKSVAGNASLTGDAVCAPSLAGLIYDPDLLDTPLFQVQLIPGGIR